MDTIGEAVEYIAALSKQAASHDLTHMIGLSNPANGKIFSYPFRIKTTQYGREIGEAISPFRSAKMTVSTLRGFADAIHAGVAGTLENFQNGNLIVHVEDHHTVSVKSTGVDDFGVRDTLLTAKYQPSGAFEFGTYNGDLTKLVIALQCCFIPDEELLKLLRLVSNLKTGTGMHVQDDGFNQTITLKDGEVSVVERTIEPRIKLIPIRTFAEALPTICEFLIRFKALPTGPAVALFDTLGTKWVGETMIGIKDYLTGVLPTCTRIIC